MSFKISIPNKIKIKTPPIKSDIKGSPSGTTAPLPSDINGKPSIFRPCNSDRLKSNYNIQLPSGMKSGESNLMVEKDIFSKKPSFLYTSSKSGEQSPSGIESGSSSLQVENDIFSKKPSFLYANSNLQIGVEKDIFSNKPSFLYTSTFGSVSQGSAGGDCRAAASFGGDLEESSAFGSDRHSGIIEINTVNKDKNFSRNFIYERKETIDSLSTGTAMEAVYKDRARFSDRI